MQGSLFELPEENPPVRSAIEFYKHRHNWTNRLIAGDSLLVMNSLLEKEGLGRPGADGLHRSALRDPLRLQLPALRQQAGGDRRQGRGPDAGARDDPRLSGYVGRWESTPTSPTCGTACCWPASCCTDSGSLLRADRRRECPFAYGHWFWTRCFGERQPVGQSDLLQTTGASSAATLPRQWLDYLRFGTLARTRIHKRSIKCTNRSPVSRHPSSTTSTGTAEMDRTTRWRIDAS